jgi:hypothetical protein
MRQNMNLEHVVLAKLVATIAQHALKQFQRKWEPVSCPELRQNKELERFG